MNKLELVQKVVRYAGIADAGPSTVVGQSGELQKAIDYVDDAHAEVQGMYFDWDFLWDSGSFTTALAVDVYPGPKWLGIWDAERIFIDGCPLRVVEWADYTPEDLGPNKPWMAVIRPDNQLQLVPEPDGEYVVRYDYYRRPAVLAQNSDSPLIPDRFQNVIIGRALMLYGNYDAAPEVKQQGLEMYQTFLGQLEKHQLSRRQQTHGRQESKPITVVVE